MSLDSGRSGRATVLALDMSHHVLLRLGLVRTLLCLETRLGGGVAQRARELKSSVFIVRQLAGSGADVL